MVARVALHNMRQDRDEPIRTFGARLAGQAGVCKFTIKCSLDTCGCEVNYTEAIVRDALIRGVADPDIQLDLLSHKKQDMSLEDVLQFVEAKEAGKRSAFRLLDTHTRLTPHQTWSTPQAAGTRGINVFLLKSTKKDYAHTAVRRAMVNVP
ncbi:hypothetical protein RRG08_005179 [Elysia crispata]|uniref:Uncharacterized protein n=1 Tax=Elysia crispata TaxID=231223 RepID=A0AAE1DG40_9GAST|nr:hypothetical protein RRG08_005179 [Elysia crispata]